MENGKEDKSDFPVVQIRNLYSIRKGIPILEDFSWVIHRGEQWVLLGRNGAGKTSLVRFLCGYDWPTEGEIIIFGEKFGGTPLRRIQERIGILEPSQQAEILQRNLTSKEILVTGIHKTLGIYREISDQDLERAESLLDRFGMVALGERNFFTLSSGEKTKILLLRAILSEPELLVLDEPSANLDLTARYELYQILEEIVNTRKTTSILITHRLEEIPEFFTHICMLKKGRKIASGPIPEILALTHLKELYELPADVIRKFFPKI